MRRIMGALLPGMGVAQRLCSLLRVRQQAVSHRLLQNCAIAVCGALLLGLLLSYGSMLSSGDAGVKQSDFVAYYGGSRLVWEGHGHLIYTFRALGAFEARLVQTLQVRNGVLPYVYPPYFALALAPVSALPYQLAYFLWFLVNCGLLLLTVGAVQRHARLAGRAALVLWMAALSFLPLFVALAQGQVSILLLALIMGALLAACSGHDALAGVAVACALIKPPMVVPLLLVLVLHRRWRALATFAVTGLALLAIPVLALGLSTTTGYAHTLLQATGWKNQFGYEASLNHSFAGLAQLLLPSPGSTIATGILSAVALALLAYVARRSSAIDLPLGLAALVALLISPHVLIHDLSLLLIPVGIALRYRQVGPRGLLPLLALSYLATLVGLRLVASAPLQPSVLAMSALGIWLFLTAQTQTEDNSALAVRHHAPGAPAAHLAAP